MSDKGNNIESIGTERILTLFWRFALPGMGAMLAMAAQSIADGLIVGRFLGSSALAAVNIVLPAYTLVTTVALILGVGTQAQMSLHIGTGNYYKAKSAFKSGLTGLLFFVITGTVLINLHAEKIAYVLGANEELISMSVQYMYGVMPWLVGLCTFLFLDYILKSLGNPRISMIIMLFTILLNIILSLIFVGSLDMGVFGAGLGTGISFTVGCLAYVLTVLRSFRKTDKLISSHGKVSVKTLWEIFYNGSSEGMSEISFGITTFLFNATLMQYLGKEGVAAFTLVNYLLFIEMSLIIGVSNGIVPVIGYNYGAGLLKRTVSILRIGATFNFAIGLVFMLLFFLAGEYLVSLFLASSETEVLKITLKGTYIVSFAFLFNGLNILVTSYYTAINKGGMSLLISSLRGLVFIVIGIYTLPLLFGVDGIWLTYPFADFLTLTIVGFLIYKKIYK